MLFTSPRFRPALILTLVLAMGSLSVVLAQDKSASDLLDQGLSQYQDGELQEAQNTLERIDRVQLDEDERNKLDQTLELIEAELTAKRQLAEGRQAEDDGNLEIAKKLYRKVTSNAQAPRTMRREALRSLARVERKMMNGGEEAEPAEQPAEAEAEEEAAPAEDEQTEAAEPQPAPVPPERQPGKHSRSKPEREPKAQAQDEAEAEDETVEVAVDEAEGLEAPNAAEQAEAEEQAVEVAVDEAAEEAEAPMQAEEEAEDEAAPEQAEAAEQTEAQASEQASEKMLEQARKLRAQKLVAEGSAEADAGNYNNALKLYQQAANVDPSNTKAAQGMENMQVLLSRTGERSVLQDEVQALRVRRQRTVAQYEERMAEARKALESGNYPQATDAAALAKSVLDTNRQYLEEARYQRLRQEALDLASTVQAQEEQEQAEELAEEQEQIETRSQREREQARQERQQKVQELLRRARDLAREQKYDQALEQLEQVTFIDENNAAAQFMRDLIRDQNVAQKWREIQKRRSYEIARQRLDSMRDTVPHADLIVYPPDWPELTQRRLGEQGQAEDSEVNRIAREKLQQTIPVEFQANRFENVIEYFRNVTGANIYVQWRTLEAAGISRETPVTMQMNVSAEKALRLILDDVGGDLVNLSYSIDEGVVVIATEEFLAKETELQTYDIKDLVVQIPSFDQAPEFDLNQIASDAGDTGGGGSIFDDTTEDDQLSVPRSERIQRIMDLIRSSIDPDNWRQNGGLTSSMEELNGVLIVNTTTENHQSITGLLRKLREQRALQIAVEGRFLFVTQNFLEEVGIDVGFSVDTSTVSSIVGTPGVNLNTAGQAAGEATAVEGSLPDNFSVPGMQIGDVAGGTVTPLSFLIDDLTVSVLIEATQADVRSISVNTPRITFFNGQRAYVTLSRQVAFVSDLEPVTATEAIAFDPEISVVSDGIVLDVEGTISADRRYVTLTVRPSLAQLSEPIPTFPVFGGITDPNNESDFVFGAAIQQPTVTLTTVRTTVSVPDKGTLLLGGQRLVGEVQKEAGVPILSKIPVINRLFTNRSTVRDERTLLILIKPTIIVQSEEEERLFPGLNQAPGLYNLGAQR